MGLVVQHPGCETNEVDAEEWSLRCVQGHVVFFSLVSAISFSLGVLVMGLVASCNLRFTTLDLR